MELVDATISGKLWRFDCIRSLNVKEINRQQISEIGTNTLATRRNQKDGKFKHTSIV